MAYRLSPQVSGAVMVVAAGCFWGTSGTLQAFAPHGATPLTIGAARAVGTAVLLFAVMMAWDACGFFKGPWPLGAVFLSGFGLALYQVSFFAAAQRTGAGVAAIIAIGSAPAMAGVLGALIFRERLTARWFLSTAVAILGGALLVFGGMSGAGRADSVGVLLALVAGFAYSLEGVGVKAIGEHRTSLEIVTAMFLASALFSFPLLLNRSVVWIWSPRGMGIVFALSAMASALPFCLFTKGLMRTGIAKAYTLTLSEPLTAWLLSTFVLRQHLAPIALVGVAMICSAILILASGMREEPSKN